MQVRQFESHVAQTVPFQNVFPLQTQLVVVPTQLAPAVTQAAAQLTQVPF